MRNTNFVMCPFKLADLLVISNPTAIDSASWFVGAENSIEFLHQNTLSDEIVIYASTRSVLIHGVLALKRKLTQENISELQNHKIPMLDDCWSIQRVWGGGKGHRMYLEAPLDSVSCILAGGEKLIFQRSFTGVSRGPTPIELSQKLIHSLELYFVPERNAYCRLDSRGDIEDVVRVIHQDGESGEDSVDVVVIQRSELDKFMALSKQCLVICFDFTRLCWDSFAGWGELNRYCKDNIDAYYHGGSDGQGSYCNGVMVVRPQVTVAELVKRWKAEESRANNKYATFKIYDRKNNMNVETSCAPEFLSNYFQKSELPWEISPVFFRAEVLHRFKADPEKYSLEERRISCRNAWYLKTYDINESGQVHTYIGYLAGLPYEEQLYWQAFNEWPKGPISKRAFQTDIIGDWYPEYEPLGALKHTILKLDAASPAWWKRRGEYLAEAVHYPATDSTKEWADEILALDQFLVEGFLLKPLRALAEKGGRTIESKWGSLRVLQEVLSASGHSDDSAKALVDPMQRLHALRTEVKGHATVEKKRAAEVKARTDFGSLRKHFHRLASDCESAFNSILASLGI